MTSPKCEKQIVQDVPRLAHQVAAAGNAIMLRLEPNCTDGAPEQGGGQGTLRSAHAVTDSRQSPGGSHTHPPTAANLTTDKRTASMTRHHGEHRPPPHRHPI